MFSSVYILWWVLILVMVNMVFLLKLSLGSCIRFVRKVMLEILSIVISVIYLMGLVKGNWYW